MAQVKKPIANQPVQLKQCYANQLPGILANPDHGVKLLSLDCFDTLIWRRVSHPTDIFFLTQDQPAFRAISMDATLRVRAEKRARQIKESETGKKEITLQDVYLAYNPALSAAE